MELNSKILSLRGKVELPPDIKLENGQSIKIEACGEVVKVEEANNQDGTFDRIFKVKLSTAEIV
jgi:hypothetical protein